MAILDQFQQNGKGCRSELIQRECQFERSRKDCQFERSRKDCQFERSREQFLMKTISFFILFSCSVFSFSQEVAKDTLQFKDIYGLRVGIDLSNPIRALIDNDRKSLELVVDYRINKKIYAAVEIGYLDNFREEDNFNFSTKGQYIRLGINYNTYKNWLNMDNEVYLGARYGFSTFSQTVEDYTLFTDVTLPESTVNVSQEYTGLNANWMELVLGIKVEVLKDIYLGFSVSGRKMLFTKEPDNFKNLFVPGFDRVFLNDSGFGFNYTISYRIPLYKKQK